MSHRLLSGRLLGDSGGPPPPHPRALLIGRTVHPAAAGGGLRRTAAVGCPSFFKPFSTQRFMPPLPSAIWFIWAYAASRWPPLTSSSGGRGWPPASTAQEVSKQPSSCVTGVRRGLPIWHGRPPIWHGRPPIWHGRPPIWYGRPLICILELDACLSQQASKPSARSCMWGWLDPANAHAHGW
jgi:hypothetical protein